ncbi:MAG: hypothetical protein NTX05_06720 [Fusobacteria bacterium]|nr:hypothetical protein [Fusobacteriota bacterium]
MIKGNIIVGDNTLIDNGAMIGNNVVIGNNCKNLIYCIFEENSTIGDFSTINHCAEIEVILFEKDALANYMEIQGIVVNTLI